MRHVSINYLAAHLVEPVTHLPINAVGDKLISSAGNIPLVDGVPVFSDLEPSPQWSDEFRQTEGFAASYVGSPKQIAASVWSQPWLNDTMLTDESRIVCVGGSFVDDIPHVTKGHKFNADLFAHLYTRLPSSVMDAQDTVFVSARAEDLPFADHSVDFVYSRNALDHFENPIKATADIHRILKPGGRFCVGVYFDSSFVDAHETAIVDDQFMKMVIEPLFETVSIQFGDAPPTAAVFRNVRTRFMFFVGQKGPDGRLSISSDAIEQHGRLMTSFKEALYERENHHGEAAKELYRSALAQRPLMISDSWRQLHACLDLLAMTSKEALISAGFQMRDAGIAANWAPVADLVFGRYGISITDLPEIARVPIECPGFFSAVQWGDTLARCAGGMKALQ